MKQLTFLISFVFCIAQTSCTNKQEDFPDNINVTNIKSLKRVRGSKLFVLAPESYKPIESMIRMQKDNDTYFQILDIPGSNFLEYKTRFTKESIESQGAKVDFIKAVNFNGYEAIYISGPSKHYGETKLALIFGDKDFVTMLIGVCQTSDTKAREELKKIFSNSYYNKSFSLDPLELASFEFDESITGFKLARIVGNMFVYTPNGKEDLKNMEKIITSFQLSTIEAPTFSKAKEFLDLTITKYSGTEISNVIKKDTIINGNQAYEVSFQGIGPNDKIIYYYQMAIHKDNKALNFLGVDGENGKLIEKYAKTAHTIQF
jgi:hypothetical protein